MPARPKRPDPEPLETDDVPLVGGLGAAWAVALLVLVVLRLTGAAEVRGWWIGMCAYGAALGVVGVVYCRRRQARRTRT